MKMKCTIMFLLLLLTSSLSMAQDSSEETQPIEDRFDGLALRWLEKSGNLKTYQGLNQYCLSSEYRKEINQILAEIHYYDSLILLELNDNVISSAFDPKESKEALKDVNLFEEKYRIVDFTNQLKESCLFRKEIEENTAELKSGFGEESYDAKIMVLETELRRYLLRIDRLVLKIDDDLHLLHIPK